MILRCCRNYCGVCELTRKVTPVTDPPSPEKGPYFGCCEGCFEGKYCIHFHPHAPSSSPEAAAEAEAKTNQLWVFVSTADRRSFGCFRSVFAAFSKKGGGGGWQKKRSPENILCFSKGATFSPIIPPGRNWPGRGGKRRNSHLAHAHTHAGFANKKNEGENR